MILGRSKSGFTLLEILLTIAILAILTAVALAAINPIRQLAQARDSQRKNDVAEIHKSVQQYFIDKGTYPVQVSDESQVYNICSAQSFSQGFDGCGSLVNISKVIPVYLSGIPNDPITKKSDVNTQYKIAVNRSTGVYVEAPETEIGQGIAKTVIYVGKPPAGYVIPTVSVFIGTTTATTFISRASEAIAGWPDWVRQVIVFVVGIIIGYILSKRKSDKI